MTVLSAARVLAADGLLEPGWVEVRGGTITGVGGGTAPSPPDVDCEGHWLSAGFVDLHVHGGGGATLTTGAAEEVRRAVAFHRAHGTTTMLASLVTAPVAALVDALGALRQPVATGLLAGVHLEGPFLSATRRGAHDARHLREPLARDLEALLAAGEGIVRMVTLAPELAGGLDAVRRLAAAGVIAAVGHTDADYETTRTAIEAGARVATHLGNAMRPPRARDPGPVTALLEDARVVVELIADGLHLHPAVLRSAASAAGPDRVALVTDAIAAAGAGDGRYELGGLAIVVERGAARLADGSSLAGSTLTMDAAIRAAVAAGVPVTAALTAASLTPARVLGLEGARGAIAPGLAADLVVLDAGLRVQRVMAGGQWVR